MAVVAVAVALAVALRTIPAWGRSIEDSVGQQLGIGAAPFVGRWQWAPTRSLVLPVGLAALVVAFGPVVAERLRWRRLLALAVPAQAAWTLALAAPDGWSSLTAHLASPYDHLAGVARVGSPGGFLAHFVDRLPTYPTHVRGHPPGTVLLLWCLDHLGLGGPTAALVLVLACGGLTSVAVLVAARSLAGEAVARRAAPFLLLVPAAAFAANLDLLYAALGAWAIALLVLGTDRPAVRRPAARSFVAWMPFGGDQATHDAPVPDRGRVTAADGVAARWPAGRSLVAWMPFGGDQPTHDRRSADGGRSIVRDGAPGTPRSTILRDRRRAALVAGSGVLFGLGLLCSYGLALLVLPLAAVAVARRRLPALVGAGATAALVVALPAAWGFWWPSGLHAVRHEYLKGLGGVRPGGPFAVFDLVALVAVLGPVTVVALARLRDRQLVPVVAVVGAAVLAALATQMSKGEVERIWQPFVPWLVLACGALALRLDGPRRWRRTRLLLGAQAITAVVLAAGVRSPW